MGGDPPVPSQSYGFASFRGAGKLQGMRLYCLILLAQVSLFYSASIQIKIPKEILEYQAVPERGLGGFFMALRMVPPPTCVDFLVRALRKESFPKNLLKSWSNPFIHCLVGSARWPGPCE